MAYFLQYELTCAWYPDGAGAMTQAGAQKRVFRPQPGPQVNVVGTGGTLLGGIAGLSPMATTGGWPVGPGPVGILVPGGYPLTQANLRLALHGVNTAPVGGGPASMAGDLDAQLATALPILQAWTSGGG